MLYPSLDVHKEHIVNLRVTSALPCANMSRNDKSQRKCVLIFDTTQCDNSKIQPYVYIPNVRTENTSPILYTKRELNIMLVAAFQQDKSHLPASPLALNHPVPRN